MMTLSKSGKGKKGAVIELTIVFSVVVLALGLLLITLIGSGYSVNKSLKRQMTLQETISQMGDYFLKACECGGKLPTGAQTVTYNALTQTYKPDNYYDAYAWMDESARLFFAKCASEGYTFTTTAATSTSGSFWDFYKDTGVIRKLTVTDAKGNTVLSVSIAEDYIYDESGVIFTKSSNPETSFSVIEWTTGTSSLTTESESLGILQSIWKFAGELFQTTETPNNNTHSVVYNIKTNDTKGNELVNIPTCTVTSQSYNGSDLIMPRAACVGYKFLGWSETRGATSATYQANSTLSSAKFTGMAEGTGLTFYAVWEPYTVTLTDGTTTEVYDAQCVLPQEGWTKEDYYLSGWKDASDDNAQVVTFGTTVYAIGKNVTYTAQWKSITELVTVKYNANGGSASGAADTTLYPGTTSVTLPAASKTGYTFDGWYYGSIKAGDAGDEYVPTAEKGEVMLTAHYTPITYTVTYSIDGNTNKTGFAAETYTIEDDFTVKALPTMSGGTYSSWSASLTVTNVEQNWFTPENVTITAGKQGTGKYGNITLSTTSSQYTITLNYNGNGTTNTTHKGSVTLPSPTWDGHRFDGWRVSGETSNRTGGTSYTATGNITITAQWTAYDVTIKYENGSKNQTGEGVVTINTPNPVRTGYTFSDEWDVINGSVSNGKVTPTSSGCVATAKWNINDYTVKVSSSSSKVLINGTTVETNKSTRVQYNSVVTVKITFYENYKYSNFSIVKTGDSSTTVTYFSDYACTQPTTLSGAETIYFRMPAYDITLTSKGKYDGCLTADTLVTLADGTKTEIRNVKSGDMLLAWDFEKGEFVAAPVVFNKGEDEALYNVIHAVFSDGTEVKIIGEHGFFDVTEGKYVYFDENAAQYIGHSFAKCNGTTQTAVELVNVFIIEELTTPYDTNTYGTLCFITNDMLSISGGIEGIFNIFDVDTATMTYDRASMEQDISEYGILSYEDFPIAIPQEMFDAFNGKYLAVSVGKGITTWEHIEALAEYYLPYCI